MRALLAILFVSLAAPAFASDDPTHVEVYRSPTCGCCIEWVRHLESEGFTVAVNDVRDVRPIKREHGVPASLGSCHTALVDGYVVEGHVPVTGISGASSQSVLP